MAGASYTPGTWLGVVRSRTAVLMGPGTPADLAGAVWDLLAGRPAVHEVLAAVTGSSGGSLASIPPFGILDFDGPLRVFLRGDLELTVDSPDGPVRLDGRDVTTWNERRFAVPRACRLVIEDAGGPGQPELPLGEGAVLLQALALNTHSGPAAVGPGAAAAPAVAVSGSEDDLPEITLLPEHGVSAETVVGVLDDDGDFGGTGYTDAGRDDGPGGTAGKAGAAPDTRDAPAAAAAADGPVPAEPVPAEPAPYQQTPGDAAPASEQTTSYDHLWDRTVMRNIEDAAVREDNDADAGAGSGLPAALPAADQLPALEKGHGEKGDGEQGKGDESTAPDAEGGEVPSSPHPGNGAGRPAPRPAAGVLIDAVPWRTGGSGGPAPASSQAQPAVGTRATPGTPTLGIPPTPGTRGGTEGPRPGTGVEQGVGPDFDPDHDGQTVMKGSLPGLSAQRPPVAAPTRDDAANGPLVLARVCVQGHPNPPTAAHCACGASLLPDAVQVPRPRLGRMRLSTGELLDLDQSMVIGRQPSVSRVQGGVMPRLVQVASPGGDISRSHVEVRLEGWHVMLCDLKATNGTVLVREGQPPRRLAQNEMAILLDGDIAELGDNISLRFEEIP